MEATRTLSRGATIVKERPAYIGPGSYSYHAEPLGPIKIICLGCYRFIDGVFRCTRCTWPVCGPACQDDPWHKDFECPILTVRPTRFKFQRLGYHHIALLRALLLPRLRPESWKLLSERMEEHATIVASEARFPRVVAMAKTIEKLFKLGERVDVRLLGGILRLHQLDGIFQKLPKDRCCTCVYTGMINVGFSCVANTRYVHCPPTDDPADDLMLELYTVKKIRKGTPIVRHLDEYLVLEGTFRRRSLLKQIYSYVCKCVRCRDPTELGTYISAASCPTPSCHQAGGYLLPIDPLSLSIWRAWKCTKCRYETEQNALDRYLSFGTRELVQTTRVSQEDLETRELVDNLTAGVEWILQQRERLVHRNHFSNWDMRNVLVNMFLDGLPGIHPDTRLFFGERVVLHAQTMLSVIHELLPGFSPLRGKAYYYMARGLREMFDFALDTSPPPANTLKVMEDIQRGAIEGMQKFLHCADIHGLAEAEKMIKEMEESVAELERQKGLPSESASAEQSEAQSEAESGVQYEADIEQPKVPKALAQEQAEDQDKEQSEVESGEQSEELSDEQSEAEPRAQSEAETEESDDEQPTDSTSTSS